MCGGHATCTICAFSNQHHPSPPHSAMSSEPLVYKTRPTVSWAPIGHQPSRSKRHQHSTSGHITAPSKLPATLHQAHSACNATTDQQLVFNRSTCYSGSLSLHTPVNKLGLGACISKRCPHAPLAPSAWMSQHCLHTPLAHCILNTLPTLGLLCPAASTPLVGLINLSSTQHP